MNTLKMCKPPTPSVNLIASLDVGQAFVFVDNSEPLGPTSTDKLKFAFDLYYKGIVTNKDDKQVTIMQICKQSFVVKGVAHSSRCIPLQIDKFDAQIDFSIPQ